MELHRTFNYEGQRIHYRDEGRENPQTLVLLHGFMQSLDVWSSFTLSYMRSIRVITIDLPGHGYSGCYGETHTMEFMAKAVHAVLEHAGVDQCVMAGHSLGGYVALAYAELYPFQLRGLCLLHSHALADTEEKKQQRLKDIEAVRQNRASYIVNFIPSLFDDSHRLTLAQEIKDLQELCLNTAEDSIIASENGMIKRPSRLHVLRNLDIPIFFIYGKNDRRIPLELGLMQAMEPKLSEVLILEGVSHMAHIEEREKVKVRLLNFTTTCYF